MVHHSFSSGYRTELFRLLDLPAPEEEPAGELIRCVFLPTFHPEWCAALRLADGRVQVTVLDRSARGWFQGRQRGRWTDPVQGWVEPGRWEEDLSVPPEQLGPLRENYPPAQHDASAPALDGLEVGIEIWEGGPSWRWFHSFSSSQGMALARSLAGAVEASARTEPVRAAAAAVAVYLR